MLSTQNHGETKLQNEESATPSPPLESQLLRSKAFSFFVFYALLIATLFALLECSNVFLLQKHRAYLPFPELSLWELLPSLLASSFFLGLCLGIPFAILELAGLFLRNIWALSIWFIVRSFLYLLVLGFHWLNSIFFDVTSIYLTHIPLNPFRLMQHNVQIIFDRTMRSSLDILTQYYSHPHAFLGLTLLVGFLFSRRWYHEPKQTTAPKYQAHALLTVALFSCLGAFLLPTTLRADKAKALCYGTTFSLWINPSCHFPLPTPRPPKPTPQNAFLLQAMQSSTSSPSKTPQHPPSPSPTTPKTQTTKASPTTQNAPQRPNIILILMESIPARNVGVYGYKKRKVTPVFDQLAKRCRRYSWAFSNSNISVFGISAVLGSRVGEPVNQPRTKPIFPERLKQAGYRTGLFVPGYQFEGINKYVGLNSWDRFFDMYAGNTYKLPIRHPCHLDCHLAKEFSYWWYHNHKKSPLFAMFTMYSTHFPYGVPPSWTPILPLKKLHFYSPVYFHRSELETVRAHFDNAIRYVDYEQGKILDFLKKLDTYKNTYVIVVSDHGEDLYDHGDASHGTNLYNTQIQVPFLLCGPQIRPEVRKENVSLIDIGPTILDIAGASKEPSFEGVSLLKTSTQERPIFLHNQFIRHEEGLIVGPYKYIRSYSRNSEELYHFRNDIHERKNLAAQEKSILETMRWFLAQHKAKKQRPFSNKQN